MHNAPVRGIIFDKDGTLFDFATTWEAWARSFLIRASQGDHAHAALVGRAIGFDLDRHRFERDSLVIAGTAGEVADAMLPHFPAMDRQDLLEMLNTEAEAAPQAPAVDLLPLLSGLQARGIVLGVATNDAEAPARSHLAGAGVLEKFDFVAGYDSGHGGKPAPGQLLAFCAQAGLVPAQVLMVGDSLHDLRAGRAAMMRTVGVLTGMALADDLAPLADVVMPDIGHIPAWLDQLDTPPVP
jgi:phosphoglycolate phosphatase